MSSSSFDLKVFASPERYAQGKKATVYLGEEQGLNPIMDYAPMVRRLHLVC